MECMVCADNYNSGKRTPRTLSCGHTLCTLCIIRLMKLGTLNCPYCRSQHVGSAHCSQHTTPHNSTDIPLRFANIRESVVNANNKGENLWACVNNESGEPRHALVTLHNNQIHLHALKNGPPPPHHQTVPYKSVMELADEEFLVVFLEVSWGGQVRGCVYIVLLDTEGRTQQFRAFCTGERGPSYAGTRFLNVARWGRQFGTEDTEQVWGGDYENNDGTGGAALPGMERGRRNDQYIVPGLVVGYYFLGYGMDHNPSQFAIYTKDLPGIVDMSGLGRVLSGYEIVTTLVNLDNVQEAHISECGLLLSH